MSGSGQRANEMVGWRSRHVFSVSPASAPMDWRDSEHVTCVFCAWSVARSYLQDIRSYNELTELDWRVEVSHGKFVVEEQSEVGL
jgi:hypothetical protein